MRTKQFFQFGTACMGMALLILDSRTALRGAADGVSLAISVLVPSLFPFLYLSILLTGSLKSLTFRWLAPLGRLFHMPAGSEILLASSFLGGYPAGAQAVSDAWQSGQISKGNGEKMLAFCNNAGPSFLFGMATAFFPEKWMVWMLWLFHILGALIAARMFPCTPETGMPGSESNISPSLALRKAVSVMAVICGWVILFRVMIAFLDRWIFWLFPAEVRTAMIGLLELSNGICELGNIGDIRLRFLICSGMISMGGICVALQTQSVTGTLSNRYYLSGKLIQTAVSLCCSAALFYNAYMLIPVVLLFFAGIRKKAVDFRQQLMYNSGSNQGGHRHAVSQKN